MRHLILVVCFSVISVLVGIFSPGVSEAQGPASQQYVVKYGDTLWDIAGAQLNNPYRWPEIHHNNPHIVNPNLIYPGDILAISSFEGGAGPQQQQPQPTGKQTSRKVIARPWYGLPAPIPQEVAPPKFPTPIVPSPDFIEATGYIVPYTMKQLESEKFGQITGVQSVEEETSPKIIHSEYGQPGLVFGDSIYINRGVSDNVREGDIFLSFRPVREIRHPFTSEVLGTQIAILGRLRIKNLEAGVSSAEIVKSYNYMEIGNPIIPASELSLPMVKPLVGNSRSYGLKVGNQLIGHIIAEKSSRRGISFGDIVFLDIGAAQGVQPADSLIVYREIQAGFPKQAIGRVVILSVQKQTSTALVTESVKTIEVGEKVVLKR